MRRPDEKKRKTILQVAGKLFGELPFHKVKLDDVAGGAGIGKGTVYIYFKSKEDLYFSLVYEGLAEVVAKLEKSLAAGGLSSYDKIRVIVGEVVDFSLRTPKLFEVLRTAGYPDASSQFDIKRQELVRLIESVIRQGIEAGDFADEHPDQTALYLMAMVRALMFWVVREGVTGETLTRHVTQILLHGISKG